MRMLEANIFFKKVKCHRSHNFVAFEKSVICKGGRNVKSKIGKQTCSLIPSQKTVLPFKGHCYKKIQKLVFLKQC